MSDSLTFSIQPDQSGYVSVDLFLRAVSDVRRFVEDVDYAVSGDGADRWVLSKLQSSAPTLTIRPVMDGRETVDAIAHGLTMLTSASHPEPPPRFTDDALDDLRRMRTLFVSKREHVREIVFSANGGPEIAIDARISRILDQALQGGYALRGSIEGNLEAVNVHGRRTITIWDRLTRNPVRCSFPSGESWTAKVRELLGKRIVVEGEVRYFRNGIPRSINARKMEDRTPDPTLPRGDFGTIPDLTGGLPTVEYVRRLREGTLDKA